MKPQVCPFCGAEAVGRSDGSTTGRPFYVRCSRSPCPGFNTSQGYADPEQALSAWNMRVLLPPAHRERVGDVYGFTTKSLMRGELVSMTLDRTGVLTSDAIAFGPHSEPLMKKPRV